MSLETTFSSIVPSSDFDNNYEEIRDFLIAQALSTPVDITDLAQAMVAFTQAALNYQSIGRKLLMVDELPQGAYATYHTDVTTQTDVIP